MTNGARPARAAPLSYLAERVVLRRVDPDAARVQAAVAGHERAADPELEHVQVVLRLVMVAAVAVVVLDVGEERRAVAAHARDPGGIASVADAERGDPARVEVERLGLPGGLRVVGQIAF